MNVYCCCFACVFSSSCLYSFSEPTGAAFNLTHEKSDTNRLEREFVRSCHLRTQSNITLTSLGSCKTILWLSKTNVHYVHCWKLTLDRNVYCIKENLLEFVFHSAKRRILNYMRQITWNFSWHWNKLRMFFALACETTYIPISNMVCM